MPIELHPIPPIKLNFSGNCGCVVHVSPANRRYYDENAASKSAADSVKDDQFLSGLGRIGQARARAELNRAGVERSSRRKRCTFAYRFLSVGGVILSRQLCAVYPVVYSLPILTRI
jgi:hypothetical protein